MAGSIAEWRRARSLLWALLLWLSLGLATSAVAAPTVLVFGDSLSAAHGMARSHGWVALLGSRLARAHPGARVINASVSGETSAGGRSRLPAVLARTHPDIVILELGGNDGLQVRQPSRMAADLAAMIERIQKTGARILLLGMRIPPNFGAAYTQRFHQVFDTLAQRYDLAYDPFFLAPIAADRAHFQADGIHPKADVQPVLAQRVMSDLGPLLDRGGF